MLRALKSNNTDEVIEGWGKSTHLNALNAKLYQTLLGLSKVKF